MYCRACTKQLVNVTFSYRVLLIKLEKEKKFLNGAKSIYENGFRKMAERIRIEREDLTPVLKEKAARELRETPEVVENALTELRKLLKNEKSIYYKDTDDILIRYLRPTKYYPESALALVSRRIVLAETPRNEVSAHWGTKK